MTPEIAICLSIIAVAIVLFAWERIPADVVALGVMLALAASGLLAAREAFAGFSSDTVIMILGLLIMTAGLANTGVVDIAGRAILNYAGGKSGHLLLPTILVSVSVLSAFISNTAATAFFLPVVIGFAKKKGISASKYLLPLAFASIVTSSVTLISTSTNIVVSESMTQHGLPAMGMFEMAPVGIPIAVAGLLYMWLIGTRLIPSRDNQQPAIDIGHRKYQADVVVLANSPLIGKAIGKSRLGRNSGLSLVKLVRGGESRSNISSRTKLLAGDHVVLEGLRADILKVKEMPGVELKADAHLADPERPAEELAVVEGAVLPGSPLIGHTLKSAEFKERHGLQVLGLNRPGAVLRSKLSRIRLRLGDVLLLQGSPENVKALEEGKLFSIFGGVDPARLKVKMAPFAVLIFAAALTAAAAGLASVATAAIAGAFLMMLTRCIAPEQAYRDVEWKAIILIGSLLSVGAAMQATGAGKYLATELIGATGKEHATLLLAGFFLLTVVLTQIMSNQAAAIVVLPVAIETALQLGQNPRTYAMMVAVAASCSYLTPLEPSCLMVYGPGRYRFADFFRVGMPLTVLIFGLAIVLVPWVWPLGGV
jgi:di/tricarboxylate transporter